MFTGQRLGSSPGETGSAEASLPQLFEMQGFHGDSRDLEHGLARVGHHLGCHVHQPTAQCGRESLDRDHRLAHILLERFKQEKAEEHGVIKGGVVNEMRKRQFFGTEVLEGPVHQFVRPALVVGVYDGVGFDHEIVSGFTQLLTDNAAHAEVGIDESAGSSSRKQELLFLHQGTPEDGSVEAIPGLAAVSELEALPDIFVGFAEVVVIGGFRKRFDHGFDVAVELAAADEADVEFLHGGEEVLVEKAGVHADDDGYGFAVPSADHTHHMVDHLFDGVAVV